jgi:hypothetical protein
MLPDLFPDYLKFTSIRGECESKRKADLSEQCWMYPTTILPLSNFLRDSKLEFVEPKNRSLAGYIDHITTQGEGFCNVGKTYMPLTSLPQDRGKAKTILEELFRLPNIGKGCGGEMAFKYMVSELVDNIYEHSHFTHANLLAQKYPRKNFVDISIYDNGISIPGSFEKIGLKGFEDYDALIEAINGLSSKDVERGFGLRSCLNIFTKGLKGIFLLVSRNGALSARNGDVRAYKFQNCHKLNGTLITIRIPVTSAKVNIYEYVGN